MLSGVTYLDIIVSLPYFGGIIGSSVQFSGRGSLMRSFVILAGSSLKIISSSQLKSSVLFSSVAPAFEPVPLLKRCSDFSGWEAIESLAD
jgi:hypothetical protein